jgi:hypothetical protein
MTATVTPFSAEVLMALSLGDSRVSGMSFGPWEICFAEDAIRLDGRPIQLYSWEHAEALTSGRAEAQRWLGILRAEFSVRAALRG